MSAAAALLVGQIAALKATPALAVVFGVPLERLRVFDEPPTNVPTPYVVVGDGDQELDDGDECGDASEIISQVGVWMKPAVPNGREIREAAATVRAALNAAFALDGFEIVVFEWLETRYPRQADGSSHAALTFRYQIDPLT